MTKYEFLKELREALEGQVPMSEIEDSISYFRDYFSRQEADGRSEQEILEELGSPRLIAKSIIETKGGEQIYYEDTYEEQVNEEEGSPKVFVFDSFLTKIGCLAAVIIVIILIGSMFAVALRFIGPIIMILLLIYLIKNVFGKR